MFDKTKTSKYSKTKPNISAAPSPLFYLFKIVVIGDSAVGISNLLSCFARDEFNLHSKATIGVEFQTQVVDIDARRSKLKYGTPSVKSASVQSLPPTTAVRSALIVYDISRRTTFESIKRIS